MGRYYDPELKRFVDVPDDAPSMSGLPKFSDLANPQPTDEEIFEATFNETNRLLGLPQLPTATTTSEPSAAQRRRTEKRDFWTRRLRPGESPITPEFMARLEKHDSRSASFLKRLLRDAHADEADGIDPAVLAEALAECGPHVLTGEPLSDEARSENLAKAAALTSAAAEEVSDAGEGVLEKRKEGHDMARGLAGLHKALAAHHERCAKLHKSHAGALDDEDVHKGHHLALAEEHQDMAKFHKAASEDASDVGGADFSTSNLGRIDAQTLDASSRHTRSSEHKAAADFLRPDVDTSGVDPELKKLLE